MLRWIAILFIFVQALYALSDGEILKRADALMKNPSSSAQFRAYNDYKNLYLKSVVSEDAKLKIDSLRGIVKSGKNLHIDVSQYSDELKNYKAPKTLEKAKKYKPAVVDTTKKIKLQSLHKLKSIDIKDNSFVLKFDNKLNSDQINYFTLYNSTHKRYKYVFDIYNAVLTESKNLKKEGITRIKLAQYNSNTLRLVIENTRKMDITSTHDNNELVINFSLKSNKSQFIKVKKEHITPARADRDKIIVIDAGHGGKDPGATGYKRYREKVVVLDIAKNLKTILNARGYTVYMTRDRDKFVKLSDRTVYANKKDADIFISIHANAVEKKQAEHASGVECYFLSPSRSKRAENVAAKENSADMSLMNTYGKQSFLNVLNHHKIIASNKLAIDLQRGILGTLNKSYSDVKDSGVREGPFWVLVGAQMPAVLVEVGFISNPTEAKRLVERRYQKKFALGMANGIERYFINN